MCLCTLIMAFYALDVKDHKILAALDENARQPNSAIGKNVGLSKESVKYRIDRLLGRGIILRFHTVVNYFRLGIVKYKLYLRLTNASKQKREDIARYFCGHKKTEWVVLTTGRWDLIVGFLVRNVNEFDDEVQRAATLFAPYIQEKAVTTTLHLAHVARAFLKGSTQETATQLVYHTTKDPREEIDETDESILKLIANNARLPVTDIAQRVHTTPRIVQYRLKELEREKIILAYKAHLDPKPIGRIFCKAILFLTNTTKERLNRFVSYAASLPSAVWPQRVMGSWDFELDVEAEGYDRFQDIILSLKERFPELIRSHEFCITSTEFKLDLFPGCLREIMPRNPLRKLYKPSPIGAP